MTFQLRHCLLTCNFSPSVFILLASSLEKQVTCQGYGDWPLASITVDVIWLVPFDIYRGVREVDQHVSACLNLKPPGLVLFNYLFLTFWESNRLLMCTLTLPVQPEIPLQWCPEHWPSDGLCEILSLTWKQRADMIATHLQLTSLIDRKDGHATYLISSYRHGTHIVLVLHIVLAVMHVYVYYGTSTSLAMIFCTVSSDHCT